MRIALITLALAALAFIGSIIYSMSGKEGLFGTSSSSNTGEPKTDTPIEIENLKQGIKLTEKIDELTKKVENLELALAKNGGTSKTTLSGEVSVSQNGNQTIPISGKFLAKVMPTMEFTLGDNQGIYGLHVFDAGTTYSTYTDAKMGVTVIVSGMSYNVFLTNAKALGDDVYSVNETKTFPFRSFYLNPPKPDTLVRVVIEVESQAIAIQIPKTKFATLKELLLKK